MNFLTKKSTWSNFDLWVFKLAVFTGSALIGAYFSETVIGFTKYFLIVFIISTAWATWAWTRNMKKEQ